jgi:hypothetical protein
MNEAKALAVPALLAYAGVRAAQAFAPASTAWQVAAGIAGAAAGLFIAKKV